MNLLSGADSDIPGSLDGVWEVLKSWISKQTVLLISQVQTMASGYSNNSLNKVVTVRVGEEKHVPPSLRQLKGDTKKLSSTSQRVLGSKETESFLSPLC